MRSTLFGCTLLVLLAGCAQHEEPPPDPEPAAPALGQRCVNGQWGFAISYPEGWHTNSGEEMVPCTAFHPEPFEIPHASEMPYDIAVVIVEQEAPLEELTSATRWQNLISSERLTIGNYEAWRVETESTGEGLADRGLRSLRYLIDRGEGRLLIATTHATGPSWQENREVLRRMMETIDLPPV